MQILILLIGLAISFSAVAAPNQSYAQRLFQRVVGSPLPIHSPFYRKLESYVAKGDLIGAALFSMNDKRFYALRVRGFAAPMTNKEEDPNEDFNDAQALFIGVVRDELDARLLLTGDFAYQGYSDHALPEPSRANNNHYLQFEERGLDYWKDLTRVTPQWKGVSEASGILTTRGWAKAFYDAGTNRRAVQYTFQNFLCSPIESWKDPGLPDHYVRRDVDRNPGGNPSTYQTHCRNCHSPMDGMGGAFSRLDFVNQELIYTGSFSIAPKYNQNKEVFPEGYVTLKDNWVNYAIYHHNESFGWRGKLNGNGVKEFGEMVANSKGFSRCLVKKVFREVCNRNVTVEEADLVQTLSEKFEQSNYNLKLLFANVAIENNCVSHR